jgi:hypothetical protein
MDGLTLKRTPEAIKWIQDTLAISDVDYVLKHGTYTTSIEHSMGTIKLMLNNFNNRVFCASQMVKKDCKNSELGQKIMNTTHFKKNYDSNPKIENVVYDNCFNIDLSSAYAYCLFNNGLITKKTFNYLLKLPKMERLTSVGMLATSHVKYFYKGGECVDFKPFREPTAQIFFHLIDEINYLMQDIKWILGNDFIFYWVDGVFIKPSVSKKKIQDVENLLTNLGYKYKYEKVERFSVNRIQDKVIVEMMKNDESKRYEFTTGQSGRELGKQIAKKAFQEFQNSFD